MSGPTQRPISARRPGFYLQDRDDSGFHRSAAQAAATLNISSFKEFPS
jgi:hypothetical protein